MKKNQITRGKVLLSLIVLLIGTIFIIQSCQKSKEAVSQSSILSEKEIASAREVGEIHNFILSELPKYGELADMTPEIMFSNINKITNLKYGFKGNFVNHTYKNTSLDSGFSNFKLYKNQLLDIINNITDIKTFHSNLNSLENKIINDKNDFNKIEKIRIIGTLSILNHSLDFWSGELQNANSAWKKLYDIKKGLSGTSHAKNLQNTPQNMAGSSLPKRIGVEEANISDPLLNYVLAIVIIDAISYDEEFNAYPCPASAASDDKVYQNCMDAATQIASEQSAYASALAM